MNPQRIFSIGVIAAFAVSNFATDVCGQQAPTKEQIQQAWLARQEKVQTADFEIHCKNGIHQGAVTMAESLMGQSQTSIKAEPNPPEDMLVEGTSRVTLSGGKLRYVSDSPVWGRQSLYQRHHVDVFDGRRASWLNDPASSNESYPSALVEPAEKSGVIGNISLAALFLSFRGDHPQFNRELVLLRITGRTITVLGRPCWELVRESRTNHVRDTCFVDAQRDFVVVRKTIHVYDKLAWQLDITYAADPLIGWVPKTWEYVIRTGPNNTVVESGRRSVTRYEFNQPVTDSEFDLKMPAGTRVHDTTSGNEVQYVIKTNGEKGKAIPADTLPSYDDLRNAGSPSRFRNALLIASVVVLSLSLVAWLLLRRYKRRNRYFVQSI